MVKSEGSVARRRITARVEMRMANEIDRGQETGEVAPPSVIPILSPFGAAAGLYGMLAPPPPVRPGPSRGSEHLNRRRGQLPVIPTTALTDGPC